MNTIIPAAKPTRPIVNQSTTDRESPETRHHRSRPTAIEADEKIRISIVIPVYNVAPFVAECLESIVEQAPGHAVEVIIVDDCSTDDSIAICRDFVEQRQLDNFRIFENRHNQGVSATRNRGLDEARGEYFMFIDPDDLLAPGALSALLEAASSSGASIIKGNNTIFDAVRERGARYNIDRDTRIDGESVLTTLYRHERVRGHPWGKLFRRETLGRFRFPSGVRMAQDLYYCCEVFAHAESLLLLASTVYRYRNRDSGSTGNKFRSGSYLDWLDSVEKTGGFATTAGQRRAHRELLLRTINQLARESRALPPAEAAPVLREIEDRCQRWEIRLARLLTRDRLGPKSLLRYIKMRLALRQTRNGLRRAGDIR